MKLSLWISLIQVRRLWNHPLRVNLLINLQENHLVNQRHLPGIIHLVNLQSNLQSSLPNSPPDTHLPIQLNLLLVLPDNPLENHIVIQLHLPTRNRLVNLRSSRFLVQQFNLRNNRHSAQRILLLNLLSSPLVGRLVDPRDNLVDSRERIQQVFPRPVQQAIHLTS